MTIGEKIFIGAGFLVGIIGFIPHIIRLDTNDLGNFLNDLIYYSPFLTPAVLAGAATIKGRVGPIIGSVGILLMVISFFMLWFQYSIYFGDTNPEAGIIFLPYILLNAPFLVGSLIALFVAIFSSTKKA